jgi:hypothetical protein
MQHAAFVARCVATNLNANRHILTKKQAQVQKVVEPLSSFNLQVYPDTQ